MAAAGMRGASAGPGSGGFIGRGARRCPAVAGMRGKGRKLDGGAAAAALWAFGVAVP